MPCQAHDTCCCGNGNILIAYYLLCLPLSIAQDLVFSVTSAAVAAATSATSTIIVVIMAKRHGSELVPKGFSHGFMVESLGLGIREVDVGL
jgi:hypothetical protein